MIKPSLCNTILNSVKYALYLTTFWILRALSRVFTSRFSRIRPILIVQGLVIILQYSQLHIQQLQTSSWFCISGAPNPFGQVLLQLYDRALTFLNHRIELFCPPSTCCASRAQYLSLWVFANPKVLNSFCPAPLLQPSSARDNWNLTPNHPNSPFSPRWLAPSYTPVPATLNHFLCPQKQSETKQALGLVWAVGKPFPAAPSFSPPSCLLVFLKLTYRRRSSHWVPTILRYIF